MKYATFMQNHLELCKFVTYISFYLNIQNMQNKKINNHRVYELRETYQNIIRLQKKCKQNKNLSLTICIAMAKNLGFGIDRQVRRIIIILKRYRPVSNIRQDIDIIPIYQYHRLLFISIGYIIRVLFFLVHGSYKYYNILLYNADMRICLSIILCAHIIIAVRLPS